MRKSLDEVLDELTDEMLPWAPAEGLRTVGGQLFEIAAKEVELLRYARAFGQEEWEEVESFGERDSSVEGWKAILTEIRQGTLDYIAQASENDLNVPVAFGESWWEGLGLSSVPMHEILRNIAAHEWYHTAQLVTYIGLRATAR